MSTKQTNPRTVTVHDPRQPNPEPTKVTPEVADALEAQGWQRGKPGDGTNVEGGRYRTKAEQLRRAHRALDKKGAA